jgi:hypothetical protein
MFVKVTRSGGRSYVKLVEAFRDDAGQPRQRVVATLGRLEQVRAGAANALVHGLRRVSGDPATASPTSEPDAIRFSNALSVGDTWLLTALWHRLGFGDAFRRVLRNGRTSFDCERLLRVMVFNRLCDATSKLGVLRWLEMSRVPAVDTASVTHQRLLRAMDTLAERADAMQHSLSVLLRPLIDQELSVVFYDLTTVGVEGATELPGDVREYGMSKDGGIARQFMLGVVQTAEGLPIAHRVCWWPTAACSAWTTWRNCSASPRTASPMGQAARWSSFWPYPVGATLTSQSCCSPCTRSIVRRPPPRSRARRSGRSTVRRANSRCVWSGHTTRTSRPSRVDDASRP